MCLHKLSAGIRGFDSRDEYRRVIRNKVALESELFSSSFLGAVLYFYGAAAHYVMFTMDRAEEK